MPDISSTSGADQTNQALVLIAVDEPEIAEIRQLGDTPVITLTVLGQDIALVCASSSTTT
ncbi:hypothetical protein WL05_24690 [Burkholderia ubonensis]|nr:hypothetical protein WJ51_15260 [Burkholderia ubonensis]KVM14977.1 hypothetical protein WJ52_16155 [Burkholderia ubonensis]KVM44365.1 hypothetical protein WJ56_27900 [Burkholderia ubonensis]KVX43041.1 hypothetical protein WL05_24690 [Burkholderia ubonensis]